MDDFFASSDFTGRSADQSMGPFPFFICTLHSARTQSSLFHFSILGFNFFLKPFFFSFYFRTFFFQKGSKSETDRQTNTQTIIRNTQTNCPYRENYVHRILFFYVRISLTSNDQGPAGPDPAGGPARPVQKS